MFRPHRSIFRSVCLQAVFAGLVRGNTRTTGHVQPLFRNGWTCRVHQVAWKFVQEFKRYNLIIKELFKWNKLIRMTLKLLSVNVSIMIYISWCTTYTYRVLKVLQYICSPTRHTKCFNPLSTKLYLSEFKDSGRTAQKTISATVIKTDNLMLYREIIAVCSEIHTKHINALWAEQRISEC